MSKLTPQNFLWKKDIPSGDSFQGSRIHHRSIPTANGFVMRIISVDTGASNVSIS